MVSTCRSNRRACAAAREWRRQEDRRAAKGDALGEGILPGRPRRDKDLAYPQAFHPPYEHIHVDGIPIAEQVVPSKKSSVAILLRFSNGSGYLASHRQMAWDPPWDTPIDCLHAPRVGAGEPRASAASRRVEGAPAAAPADGCGPDVLARTVLALEELAGFVAGGAGQNHGRLGPGMVQGLPGV